MYFLLKLGVLCSNIFMKNQIRLKAKELRKTLDKKALSQQIKQKLFSLPEFISAKNVCCYYSVRDEVETMDYFDDTSKNWFVPKVSGDDLLICPFDKEQMEKSSFGLLEPTTKPIEDLSIIDLIIIPALCVDKKGNRIGYGKGYYDRLLKKIPHNPLRIALVFSDLIVENSYCNDFDEKINIIICNNSIFKI